MDTRPQAPPDDTLRARREKIVHEHMRAELAGDLDGLIASFDHPIKRYRFAFSDEVHEGEGAVRKLIADFLAAFPDLELVTERQHHADDALIIEGRLRGTHRGPFAGLPPSGRRVDVGAVIFFRFEGARLYEETVYADNANLFRQLTGS